MGARNQRGPTTATGPEESATAPRPSRTGEAVDWTTERGLESWSTARPAAGERIFEARLGFFKSEPGLFRTAPGFFIAKIESDALKGGAEQHEKGHA